MIIQLRHLKKQYQINYKKNIEVISIGKTNYIFSEKGISKHFPSSGDANGMDITIDLATEKSNDKKLILLIQFNMILIMVIEEMLKDMQTI